MHDPDVGAKGPLPLICHIIVDASALSYHVQIHSSHEEGPQ